MKRETSELSSAAVPNILAPGACLVEDSISMDQRGEVGDGLRMIQAHYFYFALDFYYYYISSTPDHQALDLKVCSPLAYMVYNGGHSL